MESSELCLPVQSSPFQLSKEPASELHQLFMQAPAMIAILKGADLVFEMVNPLYQRLFSNRELLGKKLTEALPEIEGQAIHKIIQNVFETGTPFYGNEMKVALARTAGGNPEDIFFNFIYQPIKVHNGSVTGVMVFAYEVSDLVKARQSAEEYNQRIKIMVESIPMISWISTADGTPEYYNSSWYNYTGITPGSQDLSWKDLIHTDDLDRIFNEFREANLSVRMWQTEYRIKCHNGEYRWHLGKSVPVKNQDGSIMHWVGTASDIHDQKTYQSRLEALNAELLRKNEQLQKTNTDLDNFLYMASHDLKAPIANLEGLLMAYFDDAGTNELTLFYQDMMMKSVERFKRTIKELTEVSKAQRETDFEFVQLKLADVLDDVLSDIRELIAKKDAEIKLCLEVPEINFSYRVIRSILYNLVSNALKYSSPERKPLVIISSWTEKDYTIVTVEDNGLGLSSESQQKIFMLFKRMHFHEEGSGVGLYMIKRMIENTGGRIELESEAGKGSLFRVFLKTG